jgi:hypothetical protein
MVKEKQEAHSVEQTGRFGRRTKNIETFAHVGPFTYHIDEDFARLSFADESPHIRLDPVFEQVDEIACARGGEGRGRR